MGPISIDSLDDLLSPKPILQAALFCQDIHIDLHGRLIIISAFHTTPSGPVPDFLLVNLWCYDHPQARDVSEDLELRDPDGYVLGSLRTEPFQLGGEVRRHFTYVRFCNVYFGVKGTHEVRIVLLDTKTDALVNVTSAPLIVE